MKIKSIFLGSSAKFGGSEVNNFYADNQHKPCTITFEGGIVTIRNPRTLETICVFASNVRYFVPYVEKAKPNAAKPE